MVSPKKIIIAGALAFCCHIHPAMARPAILQQLQQRSAGGFADALELLGALLGVIGVFTKDPKINAWDFKALPDMCRVYMETKNGGNCRATVECKDSGKIEYNKDKGWNTCYVGGRQFFTDPRIGDFSITFTKKDGIEGQGLTDPVLQVKSVGNWKKWDVSGLSLAVRDSETCNEGIAPLGCHDGPWVCDFAERGNTYIKDDRTKRWECGVPKTGAKFPENLSWEIKGMKVILQDKGKTSSAKGKTAQDKEKAVQDNGKTIQDKPKTAKSKGNIVQGKAGK